jgi:hypothetical protein
MIGLRKNKYRYRCSRSGLFQVLSGRIVLSMRYTSDSSYLEGIPTFVRDVRDAVTAVHRIICYLHQMSFHLSMTGQREFYLPELAGETMLYESCSWAPGLLANVGTCRSPFCARETEPYLKL